ncbi:hypothetical protein T459_18735 [Capsicum annuum]|uniref:Uncharacterized protein n=1 Tax=Capsicum annuum TaxID=4072 RepID=A0A2G2YZR6_CAPAN|nr:hypothetical protein T459_18735 [Capsicum annuum]
MVRDARRGQGLGSGRDLNGRAASVSAMRSYRALESYRDLSGLDGSECPSRPGFGSDRDLNAIRAAPVSALLMWARVQTANPDKFTTQVVTQLTAFWPSLTGLDPKEMWREAWKTYGTCLVTPKLKGPTQYFNRAIRLSDEIGNLLEKHLIQSDGIVPCDSATYTNVEILNSLKTVTTVNNQNEKEVSFTCADINATHAYLNQVTFCYNKDAKDFEDCPTSNRCRVENIIVPRPSPPATRPSSLQVSAQHSFLSSLFQIANNCPILPHHRLGSRLREMSSDSNNGFPFYHAPEVHSFPKSECFHESNSLSIDRLPLLHVELRSYFFLGLFLGLSSYNWKDW